MRSTRASIAPRAVLAQQLSRGLSARDREILRLRFEEDMTQAQIGRELGASQMQVSRLIATHPSACGPSPPMTS